MIRHFDALLDGAARALFQIAGQRPDLAPQVGPVAAVITLIAADVDTHVARRLQEAAEIKALLRSAREVVPAPGLPRIDQALDSDLLLPSDFTLTNIDIYVASLRQALIEVHVWLESPAGRGYSELLTQLWCFLQSDADYAARLAPSMW